MSSTNNPGASRTTLAPSTTNGTLPKPSGGLVPTNNVTTKDGLTVRARIDPTLTVEDVVRQLCVNLKVTDPSSHFALRDRDTDELVTNDNLRKKIKNKVHLRSLFSSHHLHSAAHTVYPRLVNASHIEAAEIVQKLTYPDERSLRLSLFSLQKYIKVCLLFFPSIKAAHLAPRKKSSPKSSSILMASKHLSTSFIPNTEIPSQYVLPSLSLCAMSPQAILQQVCTYSGAESDGPGIRLVGAQRRVHL